MSIVSDFITRTADQFRASPSANIAQTHGGGLQSPHPALNAWLDDNPEVADALARTSRGLSAFEGLFEGGHMAFNKAHEHLGETRSAEARLHYEAREAGRTVDPELAKQAARARKSATSENEEFAARLSVASNNFASVREANNNGLRFAGRAAADKAGVVLAPKVVLPAGAPADIAADQQQTILKVNAEEAEVAASFIPVEDAVASVRAKVLRKEPRLILSNREADWLAPQKRLNVAPRLGDQPVDIDDGTALLGWLFGDLIADKLEALVRDKYRHVEKTYTPTERRAVLADIAARRLQAERIEVAAIFAAWDAGNFIPLRKDVSPLALLGIERLTEGVPDPEGYVGSAFLGETAR